MKTVQEFVEVLQVAQTQGLLDQGYNPELHNYVVKYHEGKKYTRVDVGTSGKYMVVNATGEIFGIKAYGVIHKGHQYGTLDTISDWDWRGYAAHKRQAVQS